jgi:catechol 2,3-dioxygenase-like lactoylglutathione lyase family enzyme
MSRSLIGIYAGTTDAAQEATMSTTTAIRSENSTTDAQVGKVDLKLEVITIPVSDVDQAKEFYGGRLGWRLDADFSEGDDRAIQFTPPGSPCSVHFGKNLTSAAPGSAQSLWLIVSDIQAARDELLGRGVEVSEVFHFAGFNRLDPKGRLRGPDPGRHTYASFVSFSDPDGNGWLLQEITTRLPGRIDATETAFASTADLASALRRAAATNGGHEQRIRMADENWPDWYVEALKALREQIAAARQPVEMGAR